MKSGEPIEKFLNKEGEKKVIVIYGPTACWKTKLSIEIAKMLNTEIISTDSRQIFKYMDIGTGKVTKEEMSGISHHMIDIIEPNTSYSVWEYKNTVIPIMEKLWSENKIPLLVGGTGLYIDSLIYDFHIPEIPACESLRKTLEDEAEKFWKEYIYQKLLAIDPEFSSTLHANNLRYVIRALEIKMLSGKSKWAYRKEKKLKYPTLFLTPYNNDREDLYKNINARVSNMFVDWLVQEVQKLLTLGYKKDDFGLQTIGYKEILPLIDRKISEEWAIEMVQKNSRNYAKRQLTWFRNYDSYRL